MAFRLLQVPSLVQRRPQVSPRLMPLPTFGTSLNHGACLLLHPSSPLRSRCLAIQGCPHINLQGWLLHHHRPQTTQYHLSQLGALCPGQQLLHFYCLPLFLRLSKLRPVGLTSAVPLLQGWGLNLGNLCHSLRRSFLHASPSPIAPAPVHRHRPHLHSSLLEGPCTSVSLTRCPLPKPLGPLSHQLALQVSAVLCHLQRLKVLHYSVRH
jgi:hypothetical protein